MVNVGIFNDHLEYFTAIASILQPFGLVCGHLIYFSHFGMFGTRKIWQPCSTWWPQRCQLSSGVDPFSKFWSTSAAIEWSQTKCKRTNSIQNNVPLPICLVLHRAFGGKIFLSWTFFKINPCHIFINVKTSRTRYGIVGITYICMHVVHWHRHILANCVLNLYINRCPHISYRWRPLWVNN
jgi:hypothetical protein